MCDAGYALYIVSTTICRYFMDDLWTSGDKNIVVKWYTSMLRGKIVTIIGLLSDTHLCYEGKWWQ